MMRAKITLSYDGSVFNGFQIQKDEKKSKRSVVGIITDAFETLNINTKIVGSGRTDTLVHAMHQVIHVDLPRFWKDTQQLQISLNKLVHPHIHIQKIEYAESSFHARFSAKRRLYRYFFYDGTYQPMLANYALHVEPLDIKELNAYARLFVGKHNFEFFKKQDGGNTKNEREIFRAGAYRHQNFIIVYFEGDAFLRSQVRMMCDFLLKMASNKFSVVDLQKQLGREQKISTKVCPACGLYLSRVYY